MRRILVLLSCFVVGLPVAANEGSEVEVTCQCDCAHVESPAEMDACQASCAAACENVTDIDPGTERPDATPAPVVPKQDKMDPRGIAVKDAARPTTAPE